LDLRDLLLIERGERGSGGREGPLYCFVRIYSHETHQFNKSFSPVRDSL